MDVEKQLDFLRNCPWAELRSLSAVHASEDREVLVPPAYFHRWMTMPIDAPSPGVCEWYIRSDCIPMWLANVDQEDIGDEVWDVIATFQCRCADLLAKHFTIPQGEDGRVGWGQWVAGGGLDSRQAACRDILGSHFAEMFPEYL